MNPITTLASANKEQILSLINQFGSVPKDKKEDFLLHLLALLANNTVLSNNLEFTVDFSETPLSYEGTIVIPTTIPANSVLLSLSALGLEVSNVDAPFSIGLEIDEIAYCPLDTPANYNAGISINSMSAKTTEDNRNIVITGSGNADITSGTLKVLINYL